MALDDLSDLGNMSDEELARWRDEMLHSLAHSDADPLKNSSSARPAHHPDGYVGPYSDLKTRNLVLQRDGKVSENYARTRARENLISTHDWMFRSKEEDDGSKPTRDSSTLTTDEELSMEERILRTLAEKGDQFKHTSEYYAAIENRKERMAAYQALSVSDALPTGTEAEIRANPFKFLGLPEDATFGQLRAAYLTLIKIWHPDWVNPKDPQQLKRYFPVPFSDTLGAESPLEWLARVTAPKDPEPGEPELVLESAKYLESLSPEERDAYTRRHEANKQVEEQMIALKTEMTVIAYERINLITRAYAVAKERFSDREQESFMGFTWQEGSTPVHGLMTAFSYKYSSKHLEGDGELRRSNEDWYGDKQVNLFYDYGDQYMAGDDYRQSVNLQAFFAWTELVQGRELSPFLLRDLAEDYKLDDDQTERLRLMVMNHEDAVFISEALHIDRNKRPGSRALEWFLDTVYKGPEYVEVGLLARDGDYFSLGVEFTQEGKLILSYHAQGEGSYYGWGCSSPAQAHFTKLDVDLMRSVAFGPMLSGTSL